MALTSTATSREARLFLEYCHCFLYLLHSLHRHRCRCSHTAMFWGTNISRPNKMQRQHLQMSFNGSIVSNHTVNSAHCFSYRLLVRVACMLISIGIEIGIPENPAMTMYGSRTPKIFSTGSIWSLLCDFRSDERTESYTPNWAERISAPPITKERPPCVSESRKGCVSGSSLIESIIKHFNGS